MKNEETARLALPKGLPSNIFDLIHTLWFIRKKMKMKKKSFTSGYVLDYFFARCTDFLVFQLIGGELLSFRGAGRWTVLPLEEPD